MPIENQDNFVESSDPADIDAELAEDPSEWFDDSMLRDGDETENAEPAEDPGDWFEPGMLDDGDETEPDGVESKGVAEQLSQEGELRGNSKEEQSCNTELHSNESSNISRRFAELVAAPPDRDAAILTCITAVGVHLGRRSPIKHKGRLIYPTLYTCTVGRPSTTNDWYRYFEHFENAPPVTRSGIFKAESLVHLVRDPIYRPDKVYTDKNQTPEWRKTKVDAGVTDKRRLIVQRLGHLLASKKSATALRLLDSLNAAYDYGEVSAYVGYRDGGFHGTQTAHISLLMAEPDDQTVVTLWERMPLLIACASEPALDPENNADSFGRHFPTSIPQSRMRLRRSLWPPKQKVSSPLRPNPPDHMLFSRFYEWDTC